MFHYINSKPSNCLACYTGQTPSEPLPALLKLQLPMLLMLLQIRKYEAEQKAITDHKAREQAMVSTQQQERLRYKQHACVESWEL